MLTNCTCAAHVSTKVFFFCFFSQHIRECYCVRIFKQELETLMGFALNTLGILSF